MSLRWRLILVGGLVLFFSYLAVGSLYSEEQRKAAWYLPDDGLRLGLDLRGGIHMVIGPDLDAAIGHELSAIRQGLESQFEDDEITGVNLVISGDQLRVQPANASDSEAVAAILANYETVDVAQEGDYEKVVTLTPEWVVEVREQAMLQALEVMRRRVDDPNTGIPESVITRQGRDRILVQIPGVSRVPDIFRKTGQLEFGIVADSAPSEELLRAKYPEGLPPGTEIALEKERETERVVGAYLVPEQPDITGDYLTDARVGFDNRNNEWQVNFTWSFDGGQIFSKLTEENLEKPLAIVMDGEIYSAPTIRARISRQGVITGRFSSAEARDLAIILRAGALPIPVEIQEERTVGPALGADSISRGVRAAVLGLLLVVVFAIGYYRLSGVYASFGLVLNLVMIVGMLSLFGGTLTLPGLAGLVLTVGMAVDANVIIFERIREELRSGRAPRAAIATGFQKARWTILDANITTLITALVLYWYGTGPIKGFAVTLSIGILTSVFAALVITRLLYELHPGHRNVAELSI